MDHWGQLRYKYKEECIEISFNDLQKVLELLWPLSVQKVQKLLSQPEEKTFWRKQKRNALKLGQSLKTFLFSLWTCVISPHIKSVSRQYWTTLEGWTFLSTMLEEAKGGGGSTSALMLTLSSLISMFFLLSTLQGILFKIKVVSSLIQDAS